MVRFNSEENGYAKSEVDRYIDVLEKKIREYRNKEETIQNAIINAQAYADGLKKEAEIDASMIKNEMTSQLKEISESVETIRLKSFDFIKDYENLIKNYLQPMNNEEIEILAMRFTKLDSLLESYQEEDSSYSYKETQYLEKDEEQLVSERFASLDIKKELDEQLSPIYTAKEDFDKQDDISQEDFEENNLDQDTKILKRLLKKIF